MGFFLEFISLVVFAFGSFAFAILTISFVVGKRKSSIVFRAFAAICAVVFLINLISIVSFVEYPAVALVQALLVSLLPPMMFHLLWEQAESRIAPQPWRTMLYLLYVAALGSVAVPYSHWSESLAWLPAALLLIASLCSLTLLIRSGRGTTNRDIHRWNWKFTIFLLMVATVVAALISDNPFFTLAPDYLVLLFFAVRLYYNERLAFFDTFVKSGLYFATGSILTGLVLLSAPYFRDTFSGSWGRACKGVFMLLPLWVLGPLLRDWLTKVADHLLQRRYSATEAERRFLQSVQSSNNESELRESAASSFSKIFGCEAMVAFHGRGTADNSDELLVAMKEAGFVKLLPRRNAVPYLSDDRRLLENLTATLYVLSQNVRLRLGEQERAQREQELAALASRAELRALRAQINPHFLFNALNAVAGWIRTEPEFADETIAELAEVFRYTLHRSQQEWVRVSDEIDFIRAYLAVEHARFRDRLKTFITVDPAAAMLHVPAMVIQPLVENAIKHGIAGISAAGTVSIDVSLRGHRLHVEVSDTGAGFPEGFVLNDCVEGHGLRNVVDRLRGYYGTAGQVSWENTPHGTKVTLEVPERSEA